DSVPTRHRQEFSRESPDGQAASGTLAQIELEAQGEIGIFAVGQQVTLRPVVLTASHDGAILDTPGARITALGFPPCQVRPVEEGNEAPAIGRINGSGNLFLCLHARSGRIGLAILVVY